MIDFQIEKDQNGKEFFDVTSGISYCDPQYCEVCEAGESHRWDDRDAPGFSDDGMTYTAPDGSVWHGKEYMNDGSGYFCWSESRYRFWKQDFQADELKKRTRQVRDALNKIKDPERLEKIAAILGV